MVEKCPLSGKPLRYGMGKVLPAQPQGVTALWLVLIAPTQGWPG